MNRMMMAGVPAVVLAPMMAWAGGDSFQARLVVLDPALSGMRHLAVASDDEIYIAANTNELHRIDLNTGSTTLLHAGLPLSAVGQMVIGDGRPSVETDLVLVDWNSEESAACCDGRVFRFDRDAQTFTPMPGGIPPVTPGDPFGVALGPGGDAWGDGVFVSDFQGASPNEPYLYTLDGGVFAQDPAWTVNRNPQTIAFGPVEYGGDLFVLDGSNSGPPATVWRVTPDGTILSFVGDVMLTGAAAMAFGPGGAFGTDLYVLTIVGSDGAVRRITPAGDIETVVTMAFPAGSTGGGMAFTEDGQTMLVSSNDRMYRITGGNTPGDLDGDGEVGPSDLAALLAAWGPCPPTADCAADLNGDGEAGPADLAILLANWG